MKYTIDTTKYIDKLLGFCKKHGLDINLDKPITIQDKLCWLDIYDTDPLKVKCADKIKIHEYCVEKLGKDICIPIIGIYNTTDDIDWKSLPNSFVAKCNHGSGMNIIVSDKTKLDVKDAINKLNTWMRRDFAFQNGFEAHYHDIEKKIFIEQYMNDGHKDLIDYKILCFNGKPKFIQVIGGRNESTRHLNYYDENFNFVDICRLDFKNNPNIKDNKPKNLNEMFELAEKLSQPFKFVRVDFYEIEGKVYLGELTFTPGAMIFKYKNKEDNIKMGNYLKL
jgi:hypothetical protein